MRMRSLILASLLPLALGCPGDDSSDTDAHETEHEHTSSTTGDTTPGTTTDDTSMPTGSTTATTMESTSTGPMDGSSTTAMGDSTSGTTGEGTTGAGADCAGFCTSYFDACGDSTDNDYGDQAGCEAACAGYDQATFECKEYHASMADGPGSVHCGHANIDGGGVC